MCNIAGYLGSERAAPILLDLIERQEGLAGGFYTGIATIHEGALHWRKVIGDCRRLREDTDADELPGTIGLAHSRSNSGGDWRWSHPFIGCDDSLAYIANGSMGYYDGRTDVSAAARALEAAGHRFTAVAHEQIGKYPALEGGRSVHVSDLMAHAIEAELAEGRTPQEAIRRVFLALPTEIVGLFITPQHADHIFAARFTMPMCVAIDDEGARIASSPTGFGERPDWWSWIAPFSLATVSAGGFTCAPLHCAEGPLPDDISRADARDAVMSATSDRGPLPVGPLLDAVKRFSGRSELVVRYDPVYEVLFELLLSGEIQQTTLRVPGAAAGLDAPQFRFAPRGLSGESSRA